MRCKTSCSSISTNWLPVLGFLLLLTPSAQAGFFGKQVRYDYLFPSATTAWESAVFTVGNGPEYITGTSGKTVIDLDETCITIGPNTGISSGQGLSYYPGPFNGYGFTEVSGTIPDILTVQFDPATTIPGLSSARISFTPDSIKLNLVNVLANAADIIKLDVVFAPEPVSAMLLGAGLLALGVAGRRLNRA